MRWAAVARLRLRSLIHRTRVEQELGEEMEYHLEREIERNLAAGLDSREARLTALRRMGFVEQSREECRDARGWNTMDNFRNDIRFGLRQLRRGREFSAIAVLILALGICASVAIFAFVDAALVKPLPYKDPARLLGIYERIPGAPTAISPGSTTSIGKPKTPRSNRSICTRAAATP